MIIDVEKIGREVVSELLKEANSNVGPCFFPGKFKPPHKGHFEAAKYLAGRDYINRVYVIISNVTKFGITPEDSLYIWNEYLKADPDPKIKVMISTQASPVKDIYQFLKDNPEISPVYVAAAAEEVEGEGRFGNLGKNFPDRIKIEVIPDQFGRISATQMRAAVATGDYEDVAKFVPDAAYNKGVAKDVFSRLIKIMK